MINLKQIIDAILEIRTLKSMPLEEEYKSSNNQIVVMSMSHEEKTQTPLEKRANRIRIMREKVIYRMKAAEEQFVHFQRELDYAFRLLAEEPLDDVINRYHLNEVVAQMPPLAARDKQSVINEIIR